MNSSSEQPHGSQFSGQVGWGEYPALVVVDLVRAYVDPEGPFTLPSVASAVTATARLVEVMRRCGFPVVWTDVRYSADMSEAGLFYKKVPGLAAFAEHSSGKAGELVLEPHPDDLRVTKHYASAFFGTSLATTLHTKGVDTVLVAGVSTSGCVRATATDALNHGFRPQVIREACADRNSDLHDSNLRDLDAKYADVCRVDEAILQVTAAAGLHRSSDV